MAINFVLNKDAMEAVQVQAALDAVTGFREPFKTGFTGAERAALRSNLEQHLRHLLDNIKFHAARLEKL